jgi:Flp pilus assembly protein CpaB
VRLRPPPPSRPDPARIPGRAPAWQRRYRRHRRALAAVLAGVVVWGVTSELRPPDPATGPALVAVRDLAPGALLGAADLQVVQRDLAALPVDAARGPDEVVGRTVSFPVRAGEPLTARHVVGGGLLEALGPGLVATPVALADAASGSLVSRGDLVDVLAAASGAATGSPTASVVASRVRVLVAPAREQGATGGLLGAPAAAGGDAGAGLVLATTTEQALAIARAAVTSRLSLTIRGA